jgi:glycosyltransferase involved in cell wall biosynthesis
MLNSPEISVLICTHNDSIEQVEIALASLFSQNFTNFEIILVDDGSKPSFVQFLKSIKPSNRLRILFLDNNIGLTKALNYGISFCNGNFIARHDADDFSSPDRFGIQLEFLKNNLEFSAVTSYVNTIDFHGLPIGNISYDLDLIKLNKMNHLVHGSLMIRKEVLVGLNGYDERLVLSQDYGLYLKMLNTFGLKIYVIPQFLYYLRLHNNSISSRKKYLQFYYATLAKFVSKEKYRPTYFYFQLLYDFVFTNYFFLNPKILSFIKKLNFQFRLK